MTVRYKETAWHKKKLGYWPDLENPVSYNDKINWLKVFDQDKDQITCCDKLAVKDFVFSSFFSASIRILITCCAKFSRILAG